MAGGCSFIKFHKLRVHLGQFFFYLAYFLGDYLFTRGYCRFGGEIIEPFAERYYRVEFAEAAFFAASEAGP